MNHYHLIVFRPCVTVRVAGKEGWLGSGSRAIRAQSALRRAPRSETQLALNKLVGRRQSQFVLRLTQKWLRVGRAAASASEAQHQPEDPTPVSWGLCVPRPPLPEPGQDFRTFSAEEGVRRRLELWRLRVKLKRLEPAGPTWSDDLGPSGTLQEGRASPPSSSRPSDTHHTILPSDPTIAKLPQQ